MDDMSYTSVHHIIFPHVHSRNFCAAKYKLISFAMIKDSLNNDLVL